MPSFVKHLFKINKRVIFFLVTFLPGVVHVQKVIAQTVGNKEYAVLLDSLLKHSVTEVSPKKVRQMPYPLLLDARRKNEFDVSHLKGAIRVGYSDFDLAKMDGIDKRKSIVVYCSVGFRSEKIVEKLQVAGYKNVSNLYGGIFEWVNNGYKIVDTSGVTNKVHAFDKNWGKWLLKGEKVY